MYWRFILTLQSRVKFAYILLSSDSTYKIILDMLFDMDPEQGNFYLYATCGSFWWMVRYRGKANIVNFVEKITFSVIRLIEYLNFYFVDVCSIARSILQSNNFSNLAVSLKCYVKWSESSSICWTTKKLKRVN